VTQQPGSDPLASAYERYEQFESRLSSAMDQLVATNGFAELFTTSASVMMSLTRHVNGAIDEAVRVTRLAARQDVTSLARQLARTEDKLERMLQLVEDVSHRLEALEATRADATSRTSKGTANGTASADDGRPARPTRAGRPAAKRTSGGSS
jgi:hypothetical protein